MRLKQRIIMKAVESPLLPGAPHGPRFAAVQKGSGCSASHKPCNLYFRVLCELTVCPDYLSAWTECGSCLSNASVELDLKGEAVRELSHGPLRVRTRGY